MFADRRSSSLVGVFPGRGSVRLHGVESRVVLPGALASREADEASELVVYRIDKLTRILQATGAALTGSVNAVQSASEPDPETDTDDHT